MQKDPSNDLNELDSIQLSELFLKAEEWAEKDDVNFKMAAAKLKEDILSVTQSRLNA